MICGRWVSLWDMVVLGYDVDDMGDFVPETEVIADGYFHESEYRSAPYFDMFIDGITNLDA